MRRMAGKRIAEKRKQVLKDIREGNARVVTGKDGKTTVKKLAPNTEKKKVRRSILDGRIFYNCPKCGKIIAHRKKMHRNLCMACGQYLDWSDYDNWACIWMKIENAEEAGYWAGQYEAANGTLYGIDYDTWRLSMTKMGYPMLLYFPFPEGKAYGRFMRKAAKEGTIIKEVNHEPAI